jgi:uncharacterized phage protein (TIGR01671 family)
MRELKFRVWDKKESEWLALGATGIDCLSGKLVDYEYEGQTKANQENYIVEQFTGLKDKNGKEIYEGDIVEEDIDFNSRMTDGTFRYRVYWDDSLLCWALDPIGKESIHDELWQTNLSRRVIGNIHENAELLEEGE